jgi:radical SAM protein (TIGR01212 family)
MMKAGAIDTNKEGAPGADGILASAASSVPSHSGGCTYCLPDALRPGAYEVLGRTVTEQLALGMERLKARYRAEKFIAYFQINTNTHAPAAELRRLYLEAVSHPEVVGLAVSTRPDCVGDDVLDLLAEVAEKKEIWLELGLQSANDRTLDRIGRGHTAADFALAAARSRARGIDVCAHLIVGLPGEDRDDLMRTVEFISDAGVWGVKFHQLQVLRGTPLEQDYRDGTVRVLGLEEYARLVVESIEALPPGVVVHRLCGDAPQSFIVAPEWGGGKFEVIRKIEGLMSETDTRQGCRWRGGPLKQL